MFGNLLQFTFGLALKEAMPYLILLALLGGVVWYNTSLRAENQTLRDRVETLTAEVERKEHEVKKLEALEKQVRSYLSSQCEGLLDYINTMPLPPGVGGVREQGTDHEDNHNSTGRQDSGAGFTERWGDHGVQEPETRKENPPNRTGWWSVFPAK